LAGRLRDEGGKSISEHPNGELEGKGRAYIYRLVHLSFLLFPSLFFLDSLSLFLRHHSDPSSLELSSDCKDTSRDSFKTDPILLID